MEKTTFRIRNEAERRCTPSVLRKNRCKKEGVEKRNGMQKETVYKKRDGV
jgi:hypothetical protein